MPDQERLLRQSSASLGDCITPFDNELWRSHSSNTPPMSPSTEIRGLSVNELKQRTAQRIAQTMIKNQPLIVDQLQQQQQQKEYLAASQNGMGEQLRRQYLAAGHFQAVRGGSSSAELRHFQSAPGSSSTELRHFQSAPGSLTEPSTPQQAHQAPQQAYQRVGIPHGLTVHELKAMTRARLAHCALVSNSNQVTTHEKAAAPSVSHSAASIFPKETRPRSGSSHLYTPRANHLQHVVEEFQAHGQQQLREVSRLEKPIRSTSEPATCYLSTTPSSQSARSTSLSKEKDCNIRMQTLSSLPHRMHQQVVPQHVNPAHTCTTDSVASRISALPDDVNAFVSSPIELDKPFKSLKHSFSVGDSPGQPSASSKALNSHHLPNSYWGGHLNYAPPFGSSPRKVSSDSPLSPWELPAQQLACENHRCSPSHHLPDGDVLCMAQSVAEFALLTPQTNENAEQFTPPEKDFARLLQFSPPKKDFAELSELAVDSYSSGATQPLSENEVDVLERSCEISAGPFESFANRLRPLG